MHNLEKQHSKTNAPDTKHCLWYILVCLGYYNKIPEPGWLIIHINFFLSLLEAEQFKIRVPEGSGSELLTADFLSPHLVEGVMEFSGASFTRALISFIKVKPPDNSSSHLIYLFACLFVLFRFFTITEVSVAVCPEASNIFRAHGKEVWEISFNRCKEFSSVQFSCSVMSDLCDPMDCPACQASLSITSSWSLLKLMSIESVMPSDRLIFCRPLLLLPFNLSQH